jgi:hypothetical protein
LCILQSSNILSAVLCLIKELDYPHLEVVEVAVRSRMDELWLCWLCGHCLLLYQQYEHDSLLWLLSLASRNICDSLVFITFLYTHLVMWEFSKLMLLKFLLLVVRVIVLEVWGPVTCKSCIYMQCNWWCSWYISIYRLSQDQIMCQVCYRL